MDETLISPEIYITTTFATLLQPFNPSPSVIQKWATLLLSAYSEPHRHYHTTTHIYSMLQQFSSFLPQITNPTALGLAIIFHDWEYIPHSPPSWNENQSNVHFAVFAEELCLPPSIVSTVKKYISATIKHEIDRWSEEDGDLKLFLDFDLEVLGRERGEYQAYMRQIRKEYGQFSDEQYAWGRKAVLEKFLERGRLYFSDVFLDRCESRARENLTWEVAMLKGSGEWNPLADLMGNGV